MLKIIDMKIFRQAINKKNSETSEINILIIDFYIFEDLTHFLSLKVSF